MMDLVGWILFGIAVTIMVMNKIKKGAARALEDVNVFGNIVLPEPTDPRWVRVCDGRYALGELTLESRGVTSDHKVLPRGTCCPPEQIHWVLFAGSNLLLLSVRRSDLYAQAVVKGHRVQVMQSLAPKVQKIVESAPLPAEKRRSS
jgi:hypothetical protein